LRYKIDFETTLAKRTIPEPNTGCWLWIGATNHRGYGELGYDRKHYFAHRFSYEYFIGPIPKGLVIDHLCKVRCCVNPRHLEPVTQAINLIRGEHFPIWEKHKAKTHCPKGHEYSGRNLVPVLDGRGRACRQCRVETTRNWRAAKRA